MGFDMVDEKTSCWAADVARQDYLRAGYFYKKKREKNRHDIWLSCAIPSVLEWFV